MSDGRSWTVDALPEALRSALALAIDKGARAPAVLRVTEIAGYTDWVLILSGRSERNVQGITDGILEGLSARRVSPIGTDGLNQHAWAILDFGDFLVHVFYHPVRTHFNLEGMWRDAPRVDLGLPKEIMDVRDLEGLIPPDPMPQFRGNFEFGGFGDEFPDEDDDVASTPSSADGEVAAETYDEDSDPDHFDDLDEEDPEFVDDDEPMTGDVYEDELEDELADGIPADATKAPAKKPASKDQDPDGDDPLFDD